MNRSEIYSNIRTITQTDSTDLPDATLALFTDEAWRHCAYWPAQPWPFYRTAWTYTFSGDGSAYTITHKQLIAGADTTAENNSLAAPNAVEGVYDTTNDRKLRFIDSAEFERLYRTNDTTTGAPLYYTVTQGQWTTQSLSTGWYVDLTIKLWPIPTNGSSVALRIEGFREPVSFVSLPDGASAAIGGYYNATAASAVPDMPTPFHEAIQNYAIGQAFAYLDEGDRSVYFTTKCDNLLVMLEARWFSGPTKDGPLVVNGGRGWNTSLPDRLRYDFE